MKYPLHRKLKNTKYDWMRCIPDDWEVMNLNHAVRMKSGENITSLEISPDGEYPVYGGNGIRGYFDAYTHDGEFVLIGRQGALCGNIKLASGKFWASEHAVVVTPDRKLDISWLSYLLTTMDLNQYSVSAAQPGLSVESIGKLKIPFPEKNEQEKIARFLDYKTQQIDQLIKKKKALIEKLNEQRISVITQAVTKGLDKNAKMKPSGKEWLGNVPAHWEIKKFRYLFIFGRGLGITKSDLTDEGVPCISYGEIHSKYGFEVIPEQHELKCVSETYLETGKDSLLSEGDFVFADTSEDVEGSGNFSYLNSKTPIFAGYHTVIARLKTDDDPRYLAYLFDSLPYRFQIRRNVSGVKVFSITQDILKSCYVWLPPKSEQKKISDFLSKAICRINRMADAACKAIVFLEEYRSAIITDAVTGKIDVRDIKIPAAEDAA
ncbi:restriction endonuclease subunit S [Candidatus Kuenenia sp.]|uniref:restriction endonuclease subunit S n=1 Tax=Candidatus Kuenenia sp. TaxID=2499824 RepID=UPI0032209274